MNELLRLLNNQPWNITPDALKVLQHWAMLSVGGPGVSPGSNVPALTPEQRDAIRARAGRPLTAKGGAVAVLPVYGPLAQRTSFDFFDGETLGYNDIAAAFDTALHDPAVGAILLDIDSPGGSVLGLEELAAKVFAARDVKPVVAIANSFMASAAYYLGSQARELVATPSSMVGSIGTIMSHFDYSGRAEQLGIKVTEIVAGKYKAEGSDMRPLDAEALGYFQSMVDHYYAQFVDAVARGRGTTSAKVKADMGQGRMLMPAQAKAANMVDRIATFEDTLARLAGAKQPSGTRAEDPGPQPTSGGRAEETAPQPTAGGPGVSPGSSALHPSVAAAQLALAERA